MLVKQNLRFNTVHPSWREGRPCCHAECGPLGSLDKCVFRSLPCGSSPFLESPVSLPLTATNQAFRNHPKVDPCHLS